MTTTAHPNPASITVTDDGRLVGAIAETQGGGRPGQALRSYLSGMTWAEVARAHGYRSARAAEHNVGRLVAWLNGQRTPRTAGMARGTRPLSLRTFGAEIEFGAITMAAAARAIGDAVGYTVSVNGYHSGNSWDHWRVEHDGSVARNGRGGEAISPVLRGQEGLDQLAAVVKALKDAGASVNTRTGLHVHIGAGDLSGDQLARLLCAYTDRQQAFDRMVSPSRRAGRNTYCGHWSNYAKNEVAQHLKDNGVDAAYLRRTDRYRTVNLSTMHRTGTVEFRQHQGTLNGTKLTSWVKLLLALVESVIDATDEDLPHDAPELLEALGHHGLDERAARFIAGRLA